MSVFQVSVDQVTQTYNGKSGCMCGCNGKYSIHSADKIDIVNKDTGWDSMSDTNVRPRSVQLAISKVNASMQAGSGNVDIKRGHAWVDVNGRNTVVYFTPTAQQLVDFPPN